MAQNQNKWSKPNLSLGKPTPKVNRAAFEKELEESRPLGRNNFILMGIAGAMIVIGFLLMLGGSSTEEAFNPDIFSARRIIVGPAIAFLGFIFMGYGIIRKPSKN